MDPQTKVLVVDDHATISELLSLAISAEPDLVCVGTAGTAEGALELTGELHPDVVVMDARLGDDDGVETTAVLTERHPDLRVIVLTAHVDSVVMRSAAEAGASWLLAKNGSLVHVLEALRAARRGGFVVHPDLLRELVTAQPQEAASAAELTPRELEVLVYLEQGWDARRIGKRLGISLNTTRGYVRNLLFKLGAHSQLEAVAVARRRGLISDSARR